MGNLGWAEIAVIVVVALVVLGPDKLPAAAQQFGRVMRQFRRITTDFQYELQKALDEPAEAEARRRGFIATAADKPLSRSSDVGPAGTEQAGTDESAVGASDATTAGAEQAEGRPPGEDGAKNGSEPGEKIADEPPSEL